MGNISLGIAASGLDAAQTAMDTIAQNLTNANTAGYESESPDLVSVDGQSMNSAGAGVRVASIDQNNSGLLASNAAQASASLAQSNALQQVLSQAQLPFQSSTTAGLTSDLSSFWQSWDSVASDPTSAANRQQVVDGAQNLVSDLQQAQASLATTSSDANTQLASTVNQSNSLLATIAGLNGQIVTTRAAGASPDGLIDQRNADMAQLGNAIGAVSSTHPDGSISVTVGGITLVQGTWHDSLTLDSTGGTSSVVASTSGAPLGLTSGTAAGLMAAVNSYLPSYQSQLDNVANSLAGLVNGQLASGFTAGGVPGQPLFNGSGAAGISVNPAVIAAPADLAAASTPTVPDAANDGSNAQAMANLYNAPNGPDAAFRNLVLNIGNQVSSMNNQVQAQTAVSNAAQQNLQSVVGVDQNQQLTNLINFQQSYQAAAKVITTVDQAIQSLLSAV